MIPTTIDWVVVGFLGGLVGIGEMVSRYHDAPARALATLPAVLYATLNAAAAVAALALSKLFGWTFGAGGASVEWTQVLVAGFGAMALFRSSFFTVHVGEQDVAVGPASFLQIVLVAADTAVDRERAQARATAVGKIVAGVSYAKAHVALPAYCLALMQSLSQDDQAVFARQVGALDKANMDDKMKILTLALAIMNTMGEGVLRAAVNSLSSQIKEGP